MNYEKAYKEAIKRAKAMIEVAEKEEVYKSAITIFPELTESEDEKVKKIITLCLEECVHSDIIRDYEKDDAIAWLEKQGEQKPVDMVEPKFNVGDWITNGRYDKLIVGINSDWPLYMFKDGTSQRIKYVDKKYRLWNIQDARDGDVLVTPNYIYIFNSIDKETETVGFYCLMKKSDEHFSFGDYKIHDEILNSIPATKEQRDLLFAKMKKTGYVWDDENKELRGIEEQVPKQKWSEEDEDNLNLAIYHIRCDDIPYSPHDVEPIVDWLEQIKQRMGE